MLKDLITKVETWRDYAKENPYSELKEHVIYERVLRELQEIQENYESKERIENAR